MAPLANALLETDLIRTFVTISELGSFSAAAKRAHRTPSAISMQVKKLEDQLGRDLFVRNGRTVSLTSDGETLLAYARDIIKLNNEAVGRFMEPSIEGRVIFGAPDDFGTRFLPNILKRFSATHPLVEVDVVLGPSDQLLEHLSAGKLDMTLITAQRGGVNDGIGRVVRTEPLVWVGVKGGKAYKSEILPLALAGAACSWRTAAIDALSQAGSKYRIAYTSENCQGQMAALLGDLAIAPLPASLISPEFERLGKKEALPDVGNYDIRICKAPELGKASKAFFEHVLDSFESQ